MKGNLTPSSRSKQNFVARRFAGACLCCALLIAQPAQSVALPAPVMKMKLVGYVTARPDAQTLEILDDQIHFDANTRLSSQKADGTSELANAASDIAQ